MYNAEIVAGSLMLPESRKIAGFLLTQPAQEDWDQALRINNLLQKKTPSTARRLARLIRNRLEPMPEEALRLIDQGEAEVALQMLLIAAIKHSRLVGDFMREVVGGHIRAFQDTLSKNDWENFFLECANRDPAVSSWSESTRAKLFQVILRILKEARYIDATRNPRLCRVTLHPVVRDYLERYPETYAQECMDLYA
jgi:hypothetical protein